jgi:hypothetical protein
MCWHAIKGGSHASQPASQDSGGYGASPTNSPVSASGGQQKSDAEKIADTQRTMNYLNALYQQRLASAEQGVVSHRNIFTTNYDGSKTNSLTGQTLSQAEYEDYLNRIRQVGVDSAKSWYDKTLRDVQDQGYFDSRLNMWVLPPPPQ